MSYSGAALGFAALDLKTLMHRSELLRVGLALRVSFPTHTGDRFEHGVGAVDLFLPSSSYGRQFENETRGGALWGIEPGIVASLAPIDGLTVFAHITYLVTVLTYQHKTRYENPSNGAVVDNINDMDATNMYLIPNLGAQYRLLDDSLGVQLALQPTVYLGNALGASLASFGIVPGLSYTLLDQLQISLTASIEASPDAPLPFVCTDLQSNDDTPSTGCGVGRRVGFALETAWVF